MFSIVLLGDFIMMIMTMMMMMMMMMMVFGNYTGMKMVVVI